MKPIFMIIALAILTNPVFAEGTPTENRLGVTAERLAANEAKRKEPESGTVLSRYRWCQKRFDKGYQWDKVEKRCLRLVPNEKSNDKKDQ